MVNTYAVQSGGCRFESLRGFGFCLKGAHYEVDYCGKKTFLAGLQCTLTSSCAKSHPLTLGKQFTLTENFKQNDEFSIKSSVKSQSRKTLRIPLFWQSALFLLKYEGGVGGEKSHSAEKTPRWDDLRFFPLPLQA